MILGLTYANYTGVIVGDPCQMKTERSSVTMSLDPERSQVPGNWYVDPVFLGVPGVRKPASDEEALAWQVDALCAQTDPEAFFPEKGGSTREAKRICDGCEVRSECLEYALANDERFGIWGGLSERDRRKLRREAG